MDKILVIADPNFEQVTAIEQADKIAKALGATLHIVYFYYEDLRGLGRNGSALKNSLLARLDEKANDQLAQTCDNNLYTYEIVWQKHIAPWVNQYVEQHNVSMVIKTGHRSESMFYTPTDWHLLRETQAPIYIVSEQQWHNTHDILACVDLQTELSDKQQLNHTILEQARKLADIFGVNVQVLYVPLFSVLLRDLGIQYKDEVEAKVKADLMNKIGKLSKTYNIPGEHFHIHAGKPEWVIPSTAAQLHCQLVILGTVGRTGLKQKALGNTAEQILSHLKTDVLAFKPS
ncbi:universal stress protein [Thalassotalea ponticola]|uniref:universal stress protein n=1 Tax=Thalassotalea ponticola TaxID=1523392 RepID=UPI0025B30E83|nr:universal stress protein [Thalassotalea ponticola]MDN3653284.1 universal stress protein [Thalassotalea ponticola]